MNTSLRISLTLVGCVLFAQCSEKEPALEINLPAGFEASLIYSPSDHDQGSWVCLTSDDKGRLITSDQYGDLYRVTLPEGNQDIVVETLPLKIGRAQGLLWAFNSLYVSVNTYPSEDGLTSGVYRLTDTDGDDQLDTVETLITLEGAGEHGPHSLVLGPDGKYIYFIAGNHTDIPENFNAVLSKNWREDRITSAIKDPRGHANDRGAPGGWIARTDPDGKSWEVIANGFRNAYDLAFNEAGELFTYDSDMEWDLGTSWYRPTRICHVIPGAEFGWRTGSGKWPEYYTDNLPGVVSMGQGSPTGIVFGKGSHFPKKYQNGLFALDWSFGTIYFVEFMVNGASYKGKSEEFLSGLSLPVTDVIIGPDGAMYFTTGGRRSASALYKISYTDTQDAVAADPSIPPLQAARKKLTALPYEKAAVDTIWSYLGHPDRFLRYTARVALENQPLGEWEQYMDASGPADAIIQSSIALIRTGDEKQKQKLLERLSSLDLKTLDIRQTIDLLRAYGVMFSRWGAPDSSTKIPLPEFPSGDAALDRELCDLLAYLQDPNIVAKTIPLMEAGRSTIEAALIDKETINRSEQYGPVIGAMAENRPFEQSMAYALCLAQTKKGWTPTLRARYFKWFYQSLVKSGGESYRGFLEKIRQKALDNVPEDERALLAELSGETLLHNPVSFSKEVAPPIGPGRIWEVGEANDLISNDLSKRSFDHGMQMYQALLCGNCHTMQAEGGQIGPNLTQVSSRFSTWDVLQSLQTPSLAISDQYTATLYTMSDSTSLIGRTLSSDEDSVYVNVNPYQPSSAIGIAKERVVKQEISPVSLMPGGLINQLNEEELLDLMAYLKSGGDADHEVFKDD